MSMNEERMKGVVLSAVEKSDFVGVLAELLERSGTGTGTSEPPRGPAPAATAGTQALLNRIVLGDILDDSILGARPSDRTFPLRVFFGELGAMLAGEDHRAESAFTLASGLNFFFRAEMEAEAKIRVGLEVSRQFYELAHDTKVKMDPEVVAKAAPLLAAIMSSGLERVKLESVDHMKVYDSSVHERTTDSDATGSRILRPASFLCRVQTNNAVKAKAQVVT
jgi:hypothetical protein